MLEISELLAKMAQGKTVALVDVREPDEFADWAIPGAINIPLGDVASRISDIPEGELILICARGGRAGQAAEMLRDLGLGLDPEVLKDGMAGWAHAFDTASQTFGSVEVIQLRRRGKGCLAYLVASAGECVVIDPPMDLERVTEIAAQHHWRIVAVLDTHLHADHVSGASLLASLTGAEYLVNGADGGVRGTAVLSDGQEICFGESKLRVMFTPGHTRGSTTYVLNDQALFTGDVLMVESVGRPDLADQAEAFAHQLYASLQALMQIRDDAVVFPAHYGTSVLAHFGEMIETTIGTLRATQPALADDEASFVAWACAAATPRPPSYQQIVALNMGAQEPSAEAVGDLELGPNRCAVSTPH
jgi:glyoxylase-like metal-dependent hydrolase (beta-lactamase superfamily II)/rhodanese-related sulfurtransferase